MKPSANPVIKRAHIHLYFIVVGVFLILIGDSFLTMGISDAGMENAILSRHITSSSIYDFWGSNDQLPAIDHDYMPLGYYLEGWLIQHVSDSFYLEKIISLLLFLGCSFFIVYIWRLAGKSWRTGWIPLAFWLMVPIASQSATQNLNELPHTLFTLVALSAQVKLYRYRTDYIQAHPDAPGRDMRRRSLIYNIGTAMWLALAFFFKGLASLYVFFFPAVVWLFSMREKAGSPLKSMLIMLIGFTAFVGTIYLISTPIRTLVAQYLSYRFDTWMHPGHIVSNASMFWAAIKQTAIGFTALALVWIISMTRGMYGTYMTYWRHRDELKPEEYHNIRQAYIFFGCAIFGLFSVFFDENPHVYGLLPMIPMAVFGCAFVAENTLLRMVEKSNDIINGILTVVAISANTVGLVTHFSHIGAYDADTEVFSDLRNIMPLLEDNTAISVTPEIYRNTVVRNYFLRNKNITFDTLPIHAYMLSGYGTGCPPQYQPSQASTIQLILYERTTPTGDSLGSWSYNTYD